MADIKKRKNRRRGWRIKEIKGGEDRKKGIRRESEKI
jgi:hypothetical protein